MPFWQKGDGFVFIFIAAVSYPKCFWCFAWQSRAWGSCYNVLVCRGITLKVLPQIQRTFIEYELNILLWCCLISTCLNKFSSHEKKKNITAHWSLCIINIKANNKCPLDIKISLQNHIHTSQFLPVYIQPTTFIHLSIYNKKYFSLFSHLEKINKFPISLLICIVYKLIFNLCKV